MTLDQAAARLRRAGLLATDAPTEARDADDLRLSVVGEPWPAIRSIVADNGFAEVGPMTAVAGCSPPTTDCRPMAPAPSPTGRAVRARSTLVGGRPARDDRGDPRPGRCRQVDAGGRPRPTFILPARTFYAGMYPAGRRRFRQPGLTTAAILVRLWRPRARGDLAARTWPLVLFDRYAYDARLPMPHNAGRRSRFRRAILTRSLPTPDLVVVLDAPAAVLVARRAEHPIEAIEAQRRRYLELAASLPDGVVLDATADADAVRRTLTGIVWARFVARRAGRRAVAPS